MKANCHTRTVIKVSNQVSDPPSPFAEVFYQGSAIIAAAF